MFFALVCLSSKTRFRWTVIRWEKNHWNIIDKLCFFAVYRKWSGVFLGDIKNKADVTQENHLIIETFFRDFQVVYDSSQESKCDHPIYVGFTISLMYLQFQRMYSLSHEDLYHSSFHSEYDYETYFLNGGKNYYWQLWWTYLRITWYFFENTATILHKDTITKVMKV